MNLDKSSLDFQLYQALTKATHSYTLLVDANTKILHHTQPLPEYVTIAKQDASLSNSLPVALATALEYHHKRLLDIEISEINEFTDSVNFLDGEYVVLAKISVQRFSSDQQFLLHITEISRSLAENLVTGKKEKPIHQYEHEIASLRLSMEQTNEAFETMLRQFNNSDQNKKKTNEQFHQLTTELENKNKKIANSEHFIHRITEISPGIIYVYSLSKQSNVFASKSIGHVLGYSDVEVKAMGNEMLAKLILPEDLSIAFEHHETLIKTNDDAYRVIEYRIRSKSGRVRWYSSYDKIFERDENGNPTKIIGIAQDITKQKKASLELTKVNAELKAFAYAASHDLKEPLNTITTIVELLKMELEDTNENTQEFLEMLSASTTRMRSLITDLLEYALLGAGEVPFEQLDTNEIVDEVLKDLDDAITRNKAQLTKVNLPILNANVLQLKRLFQNLISNALKYRSVEHSPIIHINVEEEENAWVFSIKDNGIGIAKKHQSKIFQVFQKLHSRDQYEGTGIGLASCKRILENHKGEIWVQSEEEGSVFYFSIPKNLVIQNKV